MAIESVLTVMYALDVRGAEEQGRVTQALLDYIGDVVLDQLAHDEANAAGVGDRVLLMETRPTSATKRWRVVEILEKAK